VVFRVLIRLFFSIDMVFVAPLRIFCSADAWDNCKVRAKLLHISRLIEDH
jgi:hypothetical protein